MDSVFKRTLLLLTVCSTIVGGLFSCEQEEPFVPRGFAQNALAVSALVDPAFGFEATVGRTLSSAFGSEVSIEDLVLDDALVTLFTSDTAINIPGASQRGRYTLQDADLFVVGTCFTLQVEHAEYPTVTSTEVCIPAAVEVDSFQVEEVMDNDLGFTVPSVRFLLNDNEQLKFYKIDVNANNENNTRVSLIAETSIGLDICSYFDYHDPYGIYFSDDCFFNASAQFRLTLQTGTILGDDDPITSVEVQLRGITEDYFKYLENFQNLDDDRGWIVEPADTFTNLNGGVGIFAASNTFQRTVRLP
jgi:hypothetical protein